MSADERALAQRATTRDADAFAQLYDRYLEQIYRYIYYKVGAIPHAEDLTAQVFLKAWEAIDEYRWVERPFVAWLYRIAHNLVVDYFRTHRQAVSIDDLVLVDEDAPSPFDLASQRLTRDALQRAIAQLTDEQQQVIILKFLNGYEMDQIVQIMNKEIGAVRALQHRALATLQRILGEGKPL